MVQKKSGKAQLREEGLEKTDNELPQTSWPVINMINQKNYYTEYLKREDQYLAYRTLQEQNHSRLVRDALNNQRSLAQGNNGAPTADAGLDDDIVEEDADTEEPHGSKIIVIHPGSQYLRIGLANDALPKTVPMVIARRSDENESEGKEPIPKRVKIDNEVPTEPEKWWGEEWGTLYTTMCADLKVHMRNNRIRLMPNSKELVVNYNKRRVPDVINEHNDPDRIEWTEINPRKPPSYITGTAALRIPENSNPKYKLSWPIQHGWLNERDYTQRNLLFTDYFLIIEETIKHELGVPKKDWSQYSCVFIIPDLYEKTLVTAALDEFMRDFGFRRTSFMQESLAASFGAGYSISCVVDVGAQKTSVCCVEDGMCVEESRINLKYGGWDVTETYMKMMLFDYFPYADINLRRRYDFLVAEELKQKYCHMSEAEISSGQYEFLLRAAGQDTQKWSFRTYDEVFLAPYGYYKPEIFSHVNKLHGRRSIIDRSYDLYDGSPNDPTSIAQSAALTFAAANLPECRSSEPPTQQAATTATPGHKPPSAPSFNFVARLNDIEKTPHSSVANSPAPEGTPKAERAGSPTGDDGDKPNGPSGGANDPVSDRIRVAEESDRILPVMPLDAAIIASVRQGARGDDRKMRDFLGGVMVVGGGAKMPGFNAMLEIKLRESLPGFTKEILVGMPPRELDQQLVVWKGGSVFGRLSSSGNDSWVYQKEYEMLGSKLLLQKLMFGY